MRMKLKPSQIEGQLTFEDMFREGYFKEKETKIEINVQETNVSSNEPVSYERLQELFAIARKQIADCDIKEGNIKGDISIDKAIRRWGICRKRNINGEIVFLISVSVRLLECAEKDIMTTICHEILHTCAGCMNHGSRWKSYAAIVNRKYGYNIKRVTTSKEKGIDKLIPDGMKYAIKCEKCNKILFRAKKSDFVKFPNHYTHTCCGGTFELISLKMAEKILLQEKGGTNIDIEVAADTM